MCGTTLFRTGKTPAHEGLTPPERTVPRSGKLVIVESPAKAKTVGRFLGKGYTVRASVGHVRDLLRSQLSVDVDRNFEPKYRVPNEKKAVVKELKQLAGQAEEIFLATDPDREGEAISWHLMEAAKLKNESATGLCFMRSPSMPSMRPLRILVESIWIWSMPNKPAAFSTGWLDTASVRSYGRRCAAGFQQDVFNPWHSGLSLSGNVRSMRSFRLNIGRSQQNSNRKEFDPHSLLNWQK